MDFTYFNFYALFITLSIFIGLIVFDIFLKKCRVNKFHIILLNLLFLIFIPLFSLVLTILENYLFNHKLVIGFSSYGGAFGMILVLYLFCKIFKYNKTLFFKQLFFCIPLMYSISKIGCFLVGCCYGIKYNGIGCIKYSASRGAPLNVSLFPIQLVESITFLIIFIGLFKLKNKDNRLFIGLVLIICGVAKFSLEFLRASWNYKISFTQYISLFFIIIGIYMLIRRHYENSQSC